MLELLTALIDVDGNKEKSAATTTRHLLARSILRHDCIVQPSRAYSWWRRRVNVQVMARGVCVASFVASPFSLLFLPISTHYIILEIFMYSSVLLLLLMNVCTGTLWDTLLHSQRRGRRRKETAEQKMDCSRFKKSNMPAMQQVITATDHNLLFRH